jgi:hypothetical protein
VKENIRVRLIEEYLNLNKGKIMMDFKSAIEEKLLESSRKLSGESLIELVAYADALANHESDKIKLIDSMRRLSEEAKRNGLTEDILREILES